VQRLGSQTHLRRLNHTPDFNPPQLPDPVALNLSLDH